MMCLSPIHQIISVILSVGLYQLVDSDNHAIRSKLLSKIPNDHHLPTVTNDQDNQTQNGSFNIIVRMIAFGIQRMDNDEDEKQQRLSDPDLTVINNRKSVSPSNKHLDHSEDEQTEALRQNTRLLLLPLMIRMLLERMAERANTIYSSKDLQESHELNYRLNANKRLKITENKFYESVRRLINITADTVEVEKTTIIIFFILSVAICLITALSIFRRLQNAHKRHIIRVGSSSVNSKSNHKESQKLLP